MFIKQLTSNNCLSLPQNQFSPYKAKQYAPLGKDEYKSHKLWICPKTNYLRIFLQLQARCSPKLQSRAKFVIISHKIKYKQYLTDTQSTEDIGLWGPRWRRIDIHSENQPNPNGEIAAEFDSGDSTPQLEPHCHSMYNHYASICIIVSIYQSYVWWWYTRSIRLRNEKARNQKP